MQYSAPTDRYPSIDVKRRAFAAGRNAFLISCLALGVTELVGIKAWPNIYLFNDPKFILTMACDVTLVAFGLAGLIPPLQRVAGWALSAAWMVLFMLNLPALLADIDDLTSWVKPAELIVFTATATYLAAEGARLQTSPARTILRIAFGSMLFLFAAIHLLHDDLIASLIPTWIPWPSFWPMLTGTVLVTAGVALLAKRLVAVASVGIALMFATWLPIVHAERLYDRPGDVSEWMFALMALALTGSALIIASDDFQPAKAL